MDNLKMNDVFGHTLSLVKVNSGLKDDLESSEIGLAHLKDGQSGLCAFLEELRRSANLDAMLDAEMALITNDINDALNREPREALEMQSVEKAGKQLANGLRCYEQLTHDVDAYKTNAGHYSKQAKDGYPLDSLRDFFNSQRARMREALKRPYTEAETNNLKARNANLTAMKEIYQELQKNKLPEPVRGIESIAHYQEEMQKYRAEKVSA